MAHVPSGIPGLRVCLPITVESQDRLTAWVSRAMRHGWGLSAIGFNGLYMLRERTTGHGYAHIKVSFDGVVYAVKSLGIPGPKHQAFEVLVY